jgi:hypothetical protein
MERPGLSRREIDCKILRINNPPPPRGPSMLTQPSPDITRNQFRVALKRRRAAAGISLHATMFQA